MNEPASDQAAAASEGPHNAEHHAFDPLYRADIGEFEHSLLTGFDARSSDLLRLALSVYARDRLVRRNRRSTRSPVLRLTSSKDRLGTLLPLRFCIDPLPRLRRATCFASFKTTSEHLRAGAVFARNSKSRAGSISRKRRSGVAHSYSSRRGSPLPSRRAVAVY